MLQLGDFELTTISGGRFLLDGGAMFGVVPKPLWSKIYTPDEQNRIPQAAHCVLIKTNGKLVLIETGYGSKLPEKQLRFMGAGAGNPLLESLAKEQISPEQIDVVMLSHLHFDHAGGATMLNEVGELCPTFPNAEYLCNRIEWETAVADLPELRGAYPLENLLPLEAAGQLRLTEHDTEILPGFYSLPSPGHTFGHQSILITSGSDSAIFLGDLCPSWRHLPTLWCMAYDVSMIETRRQKPEILGRVADENWWALSTHDPDHAAVKLARDTKRDFVPTEMRELL